MARAAVDPEAPYLLAARAGGRLRIERRARAGGPVEVSEPEGGPWIRLERAHGTLTVLTGEDGHLWRQVSTAPDPGLRMVGVTGRQAVPAPVRCEVRDHLYPGPDECMGCHTASAHFVLGASTRQWNRDAGGTNQLVRAARRGLLDVALDPAAPAGWPRLAALDDETVPIEERVRSYLDANCAQCHRPGNVAQVPFDARYETPLGAKGIVAAPVRWPIVTHPSDQVVYPRSPERSRLFGFVSRHLMPPLGGVLVDDQAVSLLRR
jgi:hypothetical protein